MFTSERQLQARKGKDALGRFEHLQKLVCEFSDSSSDRDKLQVLANLCNFAYDPINYGHLRALNVIPTLLLDVVDEHLDGATVRRSGGDTPSAAVLYVRFAVGGISNCCTDQTNMDLLMEGDAVELLTLALTAPDAVTVANALAALNLMLSPMNVNEICTGTLLDCLERYRRNVKYRDIANLATVFLDDADRYRRMVSSQ